MSMVIKRIHTNLALMSLGHKHTFDAKDHKISFNTDYNMFQIDTTLIPVSSVREVLTEGIDNTTASTLRANSNMSGINESSAVPTDHPVETLVDVAQPKNNRKKKQPLEIEMAVIQG